MDFAALASSALSCVAGWLNLAAKKLDANNTPEMRARAAAQVEIDRKSAAEKAVKEQDAKTVQNNLAD